MGGRASKDASETVDEKGKQVELDPPPREFTEEDGAAALEKVEKDGFWGVVLQKWS